MRVLVVTNFVPDAAAPAAGPLGARPGRGDAPARHRGRGLQLPPRLQPVHPRGPAPAAAAAARALRPRPRPLRADGLVGAARRGAAAGRQLPRHRRPPLRGRAALAAPRLARDLVAAVSRALFAPEDGRPGLPPVPGSAVLPCGPDLGRFRPLPRAEARRQLGLDPDGRYLLFPANPNRPEKRADRAAEVAAACGAELLTGGSIEPDQMPLWVNAANAVLVTSDYEGFGLACVEALACDVPVLSTPVGIAPFALAGIAGTPLRALRRRRAGAPPPPSPGGSPTPGSRAPRAPPRSRRPGWRSGRSWPTARCSTGIGPPT